MEHYMLVIKSSCPYCKKAIQLLKSEEKQFIYTDMEHAPPLLDAMKVASRWETVPMVWKINANEDMSQPAGTAFLGGYTELLEHFREK